jgi:hypothetical protein
MNCICGTPLDNSPNGLHCFFYFMAQEQSREHEQAEAEELARADDQDREDQLAKEEFSEFEELEDFYTSLDLEEEYLLLFDD